ncbi:MAG: hypothetical protein Q4D19_04520, partial [Lautropia sp.]|nr:hypothetical protein [Lautropia sp.]
MPRSHRFSPVAIALALLGASVLPLTASAQSTRTTPAGNGDVPDVRTPAMQATAAPHTAANFAERIEVKTFISDMVQKHGFDQNA